MKNLSHHQKMARMKKELQQFRVVLRCRLYLHGPYLVANGEGYLMLQLYARRPLISCLRPEIPYPPLLIDVPRCKLVES